MRPRTFTTARPEPTTGLYFLLDLWPDGRVEVAFRRDPHDTWSPPEVLRDADKAVS